MSTVASLITRLVDAGVSPAQAAEIVAEAVILGATKAPKDPAAEKRRAYDRARKRKSTGVPPEATGVPVETAEIEDPFLEAKGSPEPLPKTQSYPTPSPPKGGSVPTLVVAHSKPRANFETFWLAYPRKVGKDAARKAYAAAIGRISGPDPPGVLLAALERVKATWTDAQFIPHPRTWLTQGRWQDEIPLEPLGPSHERPRHHHAAGTSRADRRAVWADLAAEERREGTGGR